MTSEELADYTSAFIDECRGRITGVGAAQYDDGTDGQQFEKMSVGALLTWAQEEAQDLAAYAAMVHIRFARLRDVLENRLGRELDEPGVPS